jgi:hypothetical protein
MKKTATGIKTHTIWIISRRRCSLSSGSSFILRTLDLDQRSGFRGADRGCDARDEVSIQTLSRPRAPQKRRPDLRSPRSCPSLRRPQSLILVVDDEPDVEPWRATGLCGRAL